MARAISTPVGATTDDHEFQQVTPLDCSRPISAFSNASEMRWRR